MRTHVFSLTFGLLAAVSFVVVSGCQEATETTSVTEAGGGDHDADHGHDHGEGDHDDHGEHGDHVHGKDGDHDHGHDEGGDHDHADDDHGHSHDFGSVADALKEIESLDGTIRDEFKANKPDAAHDPLHHIGSVLIAAEELVKKMDDSDAKTEMASAIDSLLDDYSDIDASMHGDGSEGKSYDDVSKSIQSSISALKKLSAGSE